MSVEDGIPEQGQATQPHDWEKDYKALQAEYTRSQQALKDHEGVWEDEQALRDRLVERGFIVEDPEEDTPEPDYDEDDPVAPIRSEMEQFKTWRAQIDQERGEAQFARDLKDELGENKIPENAHAWIKDRTASLGNNRKALKQAVEEFIGLADEVRGPTRRDAPTPPPAGKAGEADPNKIKDPAARRTARRARIAAQVEAGMQQQ